MKILLAAIAVFVLLVMAELWWRRRPVHGEFSRKLVHVTVGSFVAFWPFFLSWNEIRVLSVAFLLGVVISKYLGLFNAIHSVQRPTWGEVFFALAVGVLTFITQDQWVYAAAVLQMGLADGLAAVVGIKYGNATRYLVLGHRKSIVGTMTFFATSLIVLQGFNLWASSPVEPIQLLGIAALATVIENIGVKGFDNLLVPVTVGLLLTHL